MTCLGDVAFLRSGDKGDISNIAVVPRDEADFAWIGRELDVDRIRERFAGIVEGDVVVYPVAGIRAYNVVLGQAIHGGVSRSLNLDIHGKSWSAVLAQLPVDPTDRHHP